MTTYPRTQMTEPSLAVGILEGKSYDRLQLNALQQDDFEAEASGFTQLMEGNFGVPVFSLVSSMVVERVVNERKLPLNLRRANDRYLIPCSLLPWQEFSAGYPVLGHSRREFQSEMNLIVGLTISPPQPYEEKYQFAPTVATKREMNIGIVERPQLAPAIGWKPFDSATDALQFGNALSHAEAVGVLERPPFEQTWGLNHIRVDMKNLRRALHENYVYLSEALPGTSPRRRRSQQRFEEEIIWRCRYIDEFMGHLEKGGEYNLERAEHYPLLGPDIEMDLWLFEKEIIHRKPFNHKTDTLTRMYGFGRNELQFLTHFEILAAISLLEHFHLLQACVGFDETSDIAEQLEYFYYSVRDYQKKKTNPEQAQRAWDHCRREFSIAQFLVDSVWKALETYGTRSSVKKIKRREGSPNGNWAIMGLAEKRRVLRNDPKLMQRFY
ncbi:hypothetical protein F5Y19DRAFT_482707 [Xylariaceae sp. FL1651]|nr:hypothetical protein F5Y19DRAFT_482707 [Xylariaceae sp. FL1651]